MENTYIPVELPLLAASTRDRYQGVIDNYLVPTFGKLSLAESTLSCNCNGYFTECNVGLSHESRDKIRCVLSSVLTSAMKYGLLSKNPAAGVQLPPKFVSAGASPSRTSPKSSSTKIVAGHVRAVLDNGARCRVLGAAGKRINRAS